MSVLLASFQDMCILRFIPGSDDEKVAYVHLYSYLNSRGRCGVVGNAPKHVKDLYIVPLASHGKIPQVLLPFDGPGEMGSMCLKKSGGGGGGIDVFKKKRGWGGQNSNCNYQ